MLAQRSYAIFSAGSMPVFDHINQTKNWYEVAFPHPDEHQTAVQLKLHFQNVSQMWAALETVDPDGASCIQQTIPDHKPATEIAVQGVDRTALLSSLCDQICTAVGVAHMMGLNISAALQHVVLSNASKFDADDQPIFNGQGEVISGPHYHAPDLSAFA